MELVKAMQSPDPTGESHPVLRVDGLVKAYAPGRVAIRDVSLSFGRRDFVAVIGPSGAGKSTLLRCMNLLIRPTAGRVELLGTDITHASGGRLREVRGRVGMVFQGFNLVRRLSVLDNVLAGRLRFARGMMARWAGIARCFPKREQQIALSCLERVGIAEHAFRRADQLSGGQQQRVAIARVLAQEPDVILADEPIASLDPQSAEGVMQTLRDIHDARGIPVIVNLHQVDVARAFATRVVGMSRGQVCVDTSARALSSADIGLVYRGQPQCEQSREDLVTTVQITPRPEMAVAAGARS